MLNLALNIKSGGKNMKIRIAFCISFCALFLVPGCNKDGDKTGFLEFRTLNPMASEQKSSMSILSTTANPPLVGDTTSTITTSLNLCIGDVWVSQGEVMAGIPDNLEWIRLTGTTNKESKLFEDYTFTAVEIPEGKYKSIKITFRNIFYRYAQLISNPSITYDLLETMGEWITTTPCDENDTTWAKTNYFSANGNHHLTVLNLTDTLFTLVTNGEKLDGFTIEAGKTAVVSWRLGAGATEPCTTFLIDNNKNLEWDCGIDQMDFDCPPEVEYMWDFIVEYQ
jgi:hypothetical protein